VLSSDHTPAATIAAATTTTKPKVMVAFFSSRLFLRYGFQLKVKTMISELIMLNPN
jgi:hypothetical protein